MVVLCHDMLLVGLIANKVQVIGCYRGGAKNMRKYAKNMRKNTRKKRVTDCLFLCAFSLSIDFFSLSIRLFKSPQPPEYPRYLLSVENNEDDIIEGN
jgi:hypothetical protein